MGDRGTVRGGGAYAEQIAVGGKLLMWRGRNANSGDDCYISKGGGAVECCVSLSLSSLFLPAECRPEKLRCS